MSGYTYGKGKSKPVAKKSKKGSAKGKGKK